MALAERLENLGTETAFAVSLAAADWAAKGNTVYPFHLGDLNLPTPANVVEAMNKAIAEGKTGYCAAAGIAPLREALADDVGARRGLTFAPGNVVVQTGGKPVITKFIQTVMNPGDEVLYPNPGYPIYESQIEYFGAWPSHTAYLPTDTGFAIDLDQLRASISPRHESDHLQRSAEPDWLRIDDRRARSHRRTRHQARSLRALRRGVLRDALLGKLDVDSVIAGHAGTHRRFSIHSRKSSL